MKGKLSRQTKLILRNANYSEEEINAIISFLPDPEGKINKEMQLLQATIHRWANKAFGDPKFVQRRLSELNQSIIDEANELSANPYDIYSFADLFITMMDSLSSADYKFNELIYAIKVKLAINKNRFWYRDIDEKIQHKEKNNE